MKLRLEIVRGPNGHDCIVLADTRIAGPKPWGGGRVVKSFIADSENIEAAIFDARRLAESEKSR